MLERPMITLISDYGLKDSFVGMVKGVILGINSQAKIIDITHNIERHNIYEASQVIGMCYKYFPPATIHLVVVDPGVGGDRRPLLVITEDHYFIGPDNGIFTQIFEKEDSNFFKVIHLNSAHYFLPAKGSTFHGRDIFAPVAAWLSKGVDSHKFGERINDYIKISLPKPVLSNNSTISGEVVSMDHFGNTITNITIDTIAQLAPVDSKHKFQVTYQDKQLPFVNCYVESQDQTLSATINGFGHLELFIKQNHAAELFNIKIGDPVSIMLID
ncbi:MAG: SAM-dependent chlorinase/fluorinase [Nitrospirae bacterium]|nr:SAM-dependent chlorinase/fluorinase [Nitrospirota bacterium]